MAEGSSTWHCLPLQTEVDSDAEKAWQAVWKSEYGDGQEHAASGIFRLLASKSGEELYFSPEAADLADVFGANPCEKPAPGNLRLLAGDPRSWAIHFPGATQAERPHPQAGGGSPEPAFEPTEPSVQQPLE